MKKYMIVLFILVAASQGFAKKEKKDEKDLKIDSLMKANESLRIHYDSLASINKMKFDSVSTQLNNIYLIVKEKVVRSDFDRSRLPSMIDSLVATRDSSGLGFANSKITMMDSLYVLKNENTMMKTELESLKSEEAGRNRIVYQLKQLKDLLDSKTITLTEFELLKAKLLVKWQ